LHRFENVYVFPVIPETILCQPPNLPLSSSWNITKISNTPLFRVSGIYFCVKLWVQTVRQSQKFWVLFAKSDFDMSLLAVVYHLVPDAPILAAYNRDEPIDRAFSTPSIQSGKPRILASIDQYSGGTYLGINQNGMLIGVVRRKKLDAPAKPRSRGELCRDLLRANSSRQAVDLALEELHSGQYDGANFVIADPECGYVIQSTNDTEVCELSQGLTVIGKLDMDDPRDERVAMARRLLTLQTLDSPVKFLAVASKVLARGPGAPGRPSMVIREKDIATVSSTLISLGKKPRDAIYQYSNGAPDRSKFEDFSPLLRDILSRGLRESRTRASA
jgi:hypothetical protein